MMNFISRFWCRHFHDQILWPMHGQYRCMVCLRTWDVPWHDAHHSHAEAEGSIVMVPAAARASRF